MELTDGNEISFDLTANTVDFSEFVSQNKLLHTSIDDSLIVTID